MRINNPKISSNIHLYENETKQEIVRKIDNYFSSNPKVSNFIVDVINEQNKVVNSMYANRYETNEGSLFTFSYKCLTKSELIDELCSFAAKRKEVEIEYTQRSCCKAKIVVPDNLKGKQLEEYIKSNFSFVNKNNTQTISEELDISILSGENEYERI